MPRLIAETKFTYDTRVLQKDEEFDAPEKDAIILCGTYSPKARRKPEEEFVESREGHEAQGIGYDSGASGHELQGRRTKEQEQRYRHRQMKAKD